MRSGFPVLAGVVLLLGSGCRPEPAPDGVPRAVASADRLAGTAPLEVVFFGEAFGGEEPLLFRWDFGDGESASDASVAHVFVLPGTYSVRLRVTDADGDFDEDQLTVVVGAAAFEVSVTATPSAGRAPLEVQLEARTTGAVEPVSWEWDFGDGAVSALASPLHTYATGGQFTATATATDAQQRTARGQVKITVASDDLPAATVSASPTAGTAPLTVAFQGGAIGGDVPLSFAWAFGDGQTSDKQNPSHTFQAPGVFTTTLTVTDADGDSDSRGVAITVTDNAVPSVSAGATPVKGTAPLLVSFTSTVSGGDAPLTFAWDFGDGNTAGRANPSHTYAAAGLFTAEVTVTDADGDRASDRITIEVGDDRTPTVSATAQPRSGRAPLTVSFTAQASGGDAPLTFAWDFGDGTSSTVQNPSHTYTSSGTYVATVQVSDADGDVDTSTATITVAANNQPVVSASGSPTSGQAPLTVSFFASAQGGDAPLTWQWTFGDGTAPGTQQNPSHTYQGAGSYTARVVVTDADGDSDSAQVTIQASSNSVPTAQAFADRTQGIEPLKVNFTGSVSGGDAPFTYAWDFGDGANGTGETTSHTYAAAGTYTAILTVTDTNGDSGSDSLTINVAGNDVPVVSATATPTSGTAPLAVVFDATASGGNPPLTFAWDFGDTATSSVEDPSHTYTSDGVYRATVVVTDVNGDAASATVDVLVQSALPDLVASNLRMEVQGQQVIFRVTIDNTGPVDSPSFEVTFYADRSAAPVVGELGPFLSQTPLAAGATREVAGFLTGTKGQHQGWSQVDARGAVAEGDETNNVVGPVSYEVFGPVVINEVYYDPPGVDAGAFIELFGPPGTDLTGYRVVGHNGATGAVYATMSLAGLTLPADGYFVVAQDASVDPAEVQLVDPAANLQNGPDSVWLEFNTVVVDALGYGTFGATDVFAGEGNPAVDAVDASLGRDSDAGDTGDNAADFGILDYPTPGGRNPVTGDTCTYPIIFGQTSIVFQHSTKNAADDYNAQLCGGSTLPYTQEPDVVYGVFLFAGETLVAEITSATFDTVLHLRTTCTNGATEVACDDDGGTGTLSRLSYVAPVDQAVYLIVDGYGLPGSDFGTFTLQVDILP